MIVCPNCNHQNPDGAIQCEACYTPLPSMTTCPNCGATVQVDASFCGQCGFNLRATGSVPTVAVPSPTVAAIVPPTAPVVIVDPVGSSVAEFSESPPSLPVETVPIEPALDLIPPDPLVAPDPLIASSGTPDLEAMPVVPSALPSPVANQPAPELESQNLPPVAPISQSTAEFAPQVVPIVPEPRTQLQHQSARLLHVQTDVVLELPQNLSVIHIGKPNDRIPPDIDVSGFPNSEIVSRIHADIRVEGEAFYIEDVGSSNGTYINNGPLPTGNRHRLRPGDRIAFGKGDKVTFLFQLA